MSDEHVTDTVARRLARASGRRAVLAALIARCSAVRGRVNCPLIASLQEAK